MNREPNRYCERLGLPTPRVEEVAGRKGVSLRHLLVVAPLDHGRPAGLDALARPMSTAELGQSLVEGAPRGGPATRSMGGAGEGGRVGVCGAPPRSSGGATGRRRE